MFDFFKNYRLFEVELTTNFSADVLGSMIILSISDLKKYIYLIIYLWSDLFKIIYKFIKNTNEYKFIVSVYIFNLSY